MKELFLYRIKQAEKPSKKEKYIRKVMMWIAVDIVFLGLAVSLFNEALHTSYTVEITRSDVREDEGHNRTVGFTPETIPQTDGMGVHEEGEVSPDPLLTIKKVAKEEGVDWKILAALHQKETQWNCDREGDKDFIQPSFGCYQINKFFHPEVTKEQATDLSWSSHWVAKRLKRYGVEENPSYAISKHNGNPNNPRVQAYLADVNRIIASL